MVVHIALGIGFGDEGKGSICDALCRKHKATTVVRFNGGSQAAHAVVLPDGKHHIFAQFGSGTLAGARTHLSRFMLVNPLTMDREAQVLQQTCGFDPYGKTTIDREALVTNVYQVAANRLREALRGKDRHGSCGMGIGETVDDSLQHPEMALRIQDLENWSVLCEKLEYSRQLKLNSLKHARLDADQRDVDPNYEVLLEPIRHYAERYARFAERVRIVDRDHLKTTLSEGDVIFEGAQGVLLDQDFGFHPHTTWSDTTLGNADKLLKEADFQGEVRRIGILRGYTTRHGAGPFPTETQNEFPSDTHNGFGTWQEGFRTGPFDLMLADYAIKVLEKTGSTLDELAITNLDKTPTNPRICTQYVFTKDGEETTCQNLAPRRLGQVELEYGSELTRLMFKFKPVYEALESRASLIWRIETKLKVPVTLCSVGPTYQDKLPTAKYLRTVHAG